MHHENPSLLPWCGCRHHGVALYGRGTEPEESTRSQVQGSQEQRIEIVIEDRTFFLAKGGPIQIGTPIEIVVENRDTVRHGFTSSMLIGLLVSGEDDQIVTYGKGVEGFYVNPGKTLVIKFIAERPGSFPFRLRSPRTHEGGTLCVGDPDGLQRRSRDDDRAKIVRRVATIDESTSVLDATKLMTEAFIRSVVVGNSSGIRGYTKDGGLDLADLATGVKRGTRDRRVGWRRDSQHVVSF